VPVELVDAREVPRRWREVDFDDSDWRQARARFLHSYGPEWRNDHPYGLRLDSHGLRECAGAVPTPHGLVEVRVPGSEAEIDSPVPAVVVHENGTETQLEAGQHRATIR
jgi:hypothetical protein